MEESFFTLRNHKGLHVKTITTTSQGARGKPTKTHIVGFLLEQSKTQLPGSSY